MAPVQENFCQMKKLLNACLLLVFITSTLISTAQSQNHHLFSRSRLLLELEDDSSSSNDQPIITKKTTTTTKNHSKLIKPSSSNSSKNQTKLTKTPNLSPKNQTKLPKTPNPSPKNQTKLSKNQTKDSAFEGITKNQTKLIKSLPNPPKNKTTKTTPSSPTNPKSQIKKPSDQSKIKTLTKTQIKKPSDQSKIKTLPKTHHHKALEEPEEEDLVSEFTDLPSKFQETFLPDMERISKTSKTYLNKYNSQFTTNFKPYVGSRYASTAASAISFAFITIPLILVSLLFTKITAYFSLQKLILFIQIYLSIYFSILSIAALATNLEPLRLFYAAAQSAYMAVQVLQTLGYVLYLLLLIMYLVLVFSTESGAAARALGLGQTAVGLAVGLHYYTAVFHRAVLRQPPRASWKVHAVYATCFVVICSLGRLDRRKKAYLEEGGEEGKKS
ncbi:hypothetical protein SASPL_141229 [Salvia splendens]|uniref:Uncharacterized protein n=1 Tax=Salvia splendens TaxID=180675 RepID=A0A8X8ZCD5_SALSN|nr:uncharacterized protein LOC121768888 [Salvia splendens]KAG6399746.1 hypothetical protein SASPL_141229 [Salvia splendens]